MRIVGGTRRGLKLAGIGKGDAASHLRPTADRVRESLFNVLTQGRHGNRVAGARVLDLFAGTGALGLEALSRGATSATFVENGAAALALLRRNIALFRAGDAARIVICDAARIGQGDPHDLVFLDPPYGKGLGEKALETARQGGWLAQGTMIVWEEGEAPALPPWLVPCDERYYGHSVVTLAEIRCLPDQAGPQKI